jgi:hypothetical protein
VISTATERSVRATHRTRNLLRFVIKRKERRVQAAKAGPAGSVRFRKRLRSIRLHEWLAFRLFQRQF